MQLNGFSHVENNALINKNLKRKILRHAPGVGTIKTKKITVLILLVHRCPQMTVHTESTSKEK